MNKIVVFLISFFSFIVLDAVWLGFVTKSIYVEELAAIARIKDGSFDVVFWAAAVVYVLLAIGIRQFVLIPAQGAGAGVLFRRGLLFGLIVYGVYDMTNVSTLKDFTVKIALLDMAWGALVCGLVTLITHFLIQKFKLSFK